MYSHEFTRYDQVDLGAIQKKLDSLTGNILASVIRKIMTGPPPTDADIAKLVFERPGAYLFDEIISLVVLNPEFIKPLIKCFETLNDRIFALLRHAYDYKMKWNKNEAGKEIPIYRDLLKAKKAQISDLIEYCGEWIAKVLVLITGLYAKLDDQAEMTK